jgi:hypothetical protein
VPDHRIRLRGGWESIDVEAFPRLPAPLTLPVRWSTTSPRRIRLTRKFGRPRLDPRSESLWLSIGRVPGLRSASLNGQPLAIEGLAEGSLEIPLDLPERNELVLDVELPADPGDPSPWGEIALLIRPIPTT